MIFLSFHFSCTHFMTWLAFHFGTLTIIKNAFDLAKWWMVFRAWTKTLHMWEYDCNSMFIVRSQSGECLVNPTQKTGILCFMLLHRLFVYTFWTHLIIAQRDFVVSQFSRWCSKRDLRLILQRVCNLYTEYFMHHILQLIALIRTLFTSI